MSLELPYRFFRDLPERASQQLWRDLLLLQNAVNGFDSGTANLGVFGDGFDGVINFDGSTTVLGLVPASSVYTLNKDIYLASGSQVSGSAIIKTAGYRIFCNGTFTVGASALVHNNGFAPVGSTGGVGGLSNVVGGGTNAVGAGGGGFGVGGTGNAMANGVGGTGGNGGSASAGGTGTGTINTTVSPVTAAAGGTPHNIIGALLARTPGNVNLSGGNGAAAGSSAGSPAATGAGGGGAQIVVIAALNLQNLGAIRADGGIGGPATGASGNAGGGGGGGGGGVFIICGPDSTSGTVTANGAVGGAGRGTGGTGGTGANGTVVILLG